MVARRHIALATLLALAAPLRVAAQDFAPADTLTEYPHTGTWYHDRFEGRRTASGERFDQNKFTAAHWKIKLGTLVLVTNRNTGLQVVVRVNDRCPKHGVIDLSHRAANAIGIRGSQPVTVRLLPDDYLPRWQSQDTLFDSVRTTLRPSAHKSKQPAAKQSNSQSKSNAKPAAVTTRQAPAKTSSTPPSKTSSQHPSKSKKKGKARTAATRRQSATTYHLVLDTVASYPAAAQAVAHLPLPYQDQVTLQPLPSGHVVLCLPIALPLENANKLRRSLLASFPRCTAVADNP